MGIQTEYISFKNSWMIRSSNEFQVDQQRSQRRCCFSKTALLCLVELLGFLLALPSLLLRIPDLLPALPATLRLDAGTPRCTQTCHRRSQVLPDAPDGHCIGPVHSGLWPLQNAGPTTPTYSKRLPEKTIHIAANAVPEAHSPKTCWNETCWRRRGLWSGKHDGRKRCGISGLFLWWGDWIHHLDHHWYKPWWEFFAEREL